MEPPCRRHKLRHKDKVNHKDACLRLGRANPRDGHHRRDMAHHKDPSRHKETVHPRDIPHFEDPSHHRAVSHPGAMFNNGKSHLTHPHVMHHSVTRLPFKEQRRQIRVCLVVGQRATITLLDLQVSAAEGSRSWRKAIPGRRRRRGVLESCSKGSQ